MNTTTIAPPPVPDGARERLSAGVIGAYTVLAGTLVSLVGLGWDIQWHVDVGPDTFFTIPHLLLYSGSAISGIAGLAMVLRATAAQRAGRPAELAVGGSPVRVLGGTFTAPLGYLVAGTGAALFLLYGLMDLWWHTLYGFDAVLNSPPHVALFVSISITMLGSVIVFAAARECGWGRVGLAVSTAVLITFTPLTANAFDALPLPFDPRLAGTVFFTVLLVVLGALTLDRPGAALAITAILGALQLFLWFFSPWAAHVYAAAVELPLRDGLGHRPPQLAAGLPMFALLMAGVAEAMLWLRRERGRLRRWFPQLLGAASGLIVGVTMFLQRYLLCLPIANPVLAPVVDAAVGLLLGALAGFLAVGFAVLLRANAPTTTPIQEGR